MQISLRSYLTAGTAAVVGASAIALTPVISQPMSVPSLPAAASANVALAGISEVISAAVGGTLQSAQTAVGGIITEVAGFQDDIGLFVNTVLGGLGAVASTSIGSVVPAIVQSVVQLLPNVISQGFGPALGTLQAGLAAAISGPVGALSAAVNIVVGIVSTAVTELAYGLGQIAQLVPAYTAVLGYKFAGAFEAAGSVLAGPGTGFGTGAALGTLLTGLLGPTGVAGTLVNLTLGTGATAPTAVVGTTFKEVAQGVRFVPSVSTVALAGVRATGSAIYAGVQQALPSASRRARAASSVRAAASVAAPAAAVAAGSSAKSAKHGVTRRAARAN
jgi:hypothetical protein